MKVVVFEPAHLESMRMLTSQPLSLVKRYATVYATQGPAFTGIADDGEIICCAGLRMLRHGVAEGWAVMSSTMPQHYRWLHRTVKGMLADIIQSCGLRRVQISVDASFTIGCQWADHLGFQREGLMTRYGPHGEAHWLYARTQ